MRRDCLVCLFFFRSRRSGIDHYDGHNRRRYNRGRRCYHFGQRVDVQ